MPTFAYEAPAIARASSRAGPWTPEAASAVVAKLRETGLFITAVKQREESASPQIRVGGRKGVKSRDIAILTRQWAVMIRAGLNLITCLRTLYMQVGNPRLKEMLGRGTLDVKAGQPLARALGRHPKVFNTMFVHMVEAGEASGQLDTVFERLADHAEKDYALRRKIIGALTYPAVIVCVVIGVAGFLITFIVPQFAQVFAEAASPTRHHPVCLGISDTIKVSDFLPLLGGDAGFWILAVEEDARRETGLRPVHVQAADLRPADPEDRDLPVYEDFRHADRERCLDHAFPGNRRAGRGQRRGQQGDRPGADQHQPGPRYVQTPGGDGRLSPMLTEMVAIGEETGALEKMLNQVADFYDSEVETAVESLTSLIEPMIVVLLGGVVGFIVISIVIPMLDVSTMM